MAAGVVGGPADGAGEVGVGEVGAVDMAVPSSWASWAPVPKEAAWAAGVSARIKAAVVAGGEAELKMGVGYGSGMCLEGFGRAYSEATGMDLGMVLPTLLAATSFCTQGAWWAPLDKGLAGMDRIPLVFQFFGVAPSGQQKSSLLERRVLPVLDELSMRGTQDRNEICGGWKAAAKKVAADAAVGALQLDDKVWDEVYGAGRCAHSLADAGTPEGLRADLVGNGGHIGIFTAEPDVLREISTYSKDDGSLTIFVRGWDQGNIMTSRAKVTIRMQECSVPFAILTQPETFSEYTRPTSRTGHDAYMSRGVFSRAWLYEAPYLPSGTGTGAGLSDAAQEVLTEQVALAAVFWEAKMAALVELSNPYRAAKAVMQAWLGKPDCWSEVGIPAKPAGFRRELDLDPAGRAVYRGVQWIRQDLIKLSDEMDADGPGMRAKYASWFARFTEHVLRIASLLTLADDAEAEVIDAGHLRDTAERWMPWLMAAWVRVTTARGVVNAEEQVAGEVLANPSHLDLTVVTNVLRAMYQPYQMQLRQGPKYKDRNPDEGLTVSEIGQRMRKFVVGLGRSGGYPNLIALLEQVLPEMAEEGVFVVPGAKTQNVVSGRVVQRYRLSNQGRNRAAADAEKRDRKQGGPVS